MCFARYRENIGKKKRTCVFSQYSVISKDKKFFNLKLFDQFHQAFMILLVRLIAEGNPLSLHELGFSQVDVRHQHGIQVREEEDPLRMKTDFLTMQGCF